MMKPREINELLVARVEQLCRELLPNGKREGQEWVAGDLSGSAGKSLKVHLSGEKTGVWRDFASSEGGGDLLDLWRQVHNVPLVTAMRDACAWLGVTAEVEAVQFAPKKTWSRPHRTESIRKIRPQSPVQTYLASRGLSEATLKAYRVAEEVPDKHFCKDLPNNPGTIVFPFLRGGELLNVKYLAIERYPDGKKAIVSEGNCERLLWGWQGIPEGARSVVVCEGEIDCLSYAEVGIPALSVPNGVSDLTWIESDYAHLQRFDTIFVSTDMDEPGRKCAAEIVKRLGAERCRVVELPHKDANACLMAGMGLSDFARCVMTAKSIDPPELRPVESYTQAVLDRFYPPPGERLGVYTPWAKANKVFRLRPSEVTVWCGYNGSGKSLLLNHIAIATMDQRERACIASFEMPVPVTLERMVRQLSAQHDPSEGYIKTCLQWLRDRLWLYDLLGTARIDRVLAVFEHAARRYDIRHFVVDSLTKCGLGEDDYNGQKAAVDKLTAFAHRHQSHVHLVAHSRKGDDERGRPGKMDVKGTGAITDLVDNVAMVFRCKRKEAAVHEFRAENADAPLPDEIQSQPDTIVSIEKQRYTGWEGDIRLWYDPQTGQYLEHKAAKSTPVVRYSLQEVAHAWPAR